MDRRSLTQIVHDVYHEDHILSDDDYHPPIRPIFKKTALEHDKLANIRKDEEILVGKTNGKTSKNYIVQGVTNSNKGKATAIAPATEKKSISQAQNITSSRKLPGLHTRHYLTPM